MRPVKSALAKGTHYLTSFCSLSQWNRQLCRLPHGAGSLGSPCMASSALRLELRLSTPSWHWLQPAESGLGIVKTFAAEPGLTGGDGALLRKAVSCACTSDDVFIVLRTQKPARLPMTCMSDLDLKAGLLARMRQGHEGADAGN
eukprot:CAMPEP_0181462518 /NCGR_PEP_ID=MMETSP1110-20121109/34437_1 /TAXON_ID=174948 /ORGANISM="Symbiodinium sp., Strain CCMP421" /LENGTH=143 /DNA_ID=CAMNT_0023587181 /DNA_START=68 /DNA_END=499 /DNA_ORIENTATION=-